MEFRQSTLEGLDVIQINQEFWRGKRVFMTGHTGFKGSWLSLWLQSLGAELHGLALDPPTQPSLYNEACVGDGMFSTIADIRNADTVRHCMEAFRPQIVIHLAAQALVGQSYVEPVETYATNVMGTVHVLEAARHLESVRCILNITTDKCYENQEWPRGYRENDPMGGHDPYSSSKGCTELVSSAYRRSFFQSRGIALATARAGNVIGGGDWAADRLVPDILRSFELGKPVYIRNPNAIRPWQHVLEPLSGYLLLTQALWTEGQKFAEGWNFGPNDTDAKPVRWIVEKMVRIWGNNATWQTDSRSHFHEANYLKLDTSKARQRLCWQPRWDLEITLNKIISWHKAWLAQKDMRTCCLKEIFQYVRSP
jgi:CDP-glucose 4,6-dehydratase